MEVKGELVGVFEIFTMEPRRFDEEEEALLAAFARQAAVAVENARLFEEVNKRVQELEQLYQAAHAMSASLDKGKVLLKLAEQLTQVMGVTSAYILEANETLTEQTVVAEYWTDEANEKERISDMGVVYDLQNFPVITQAIKSGEVLNFHNDSDFVCEAARKELQDYNVKSALVVPIIRSGRVYGEV
jgi:GAF domain-containing protein